MNAYPGDWTDDTAITLDEACEVLFRGAIKPATLRAEAERGNLRLEKIGRRLFTTPGDIAEMRKKCRVQEKPLASSSEKTPHARNGLSGTGQSTYAQAALSQTLKALKSGSGNTSQASTDQQTASIHELSPSRTR